MALLDALMVYLITGEALLLFCLCEEQNDDVVDEFRRIDFSWLLMAMTAIAAVLMWPLMVWLGRR